MYFSAATYRCVGTIMIKKKNPRETPQRKLSLQRERKDGRTRDFGTGSSSPFQLTDIKTGKQKYPCYDSLCVFTRVTNPRNIILPLSFCEP